MQDKYMSQSVHLASLVQQEFKQTAKRIDRGVHQAGFLVLKASAMPSILVELGFISTPEEERYLNSESGKNALANSLFRAFLTYKQEQEMRLNSVSGVSATPSPVDKRSEEIDKTDKRPIFKIQILTSSKQLSAGSKEFKGLKPIDSYRENGLYKYTYGASTDYNRIYRMKKDIASRFKDAFIIAFKEGKKVDVQAAIKEFKNNQNNKIKNK